MDVGRKGWDTKKCLEYGAVHYIWGSQRTTQEPLGIHGHFRGSMGSNLKWQSSHELLLTFFSLSFSFKSIDGFPPACSTWQVSQQSGTGAGGDLTLQSQIIKRLTKSIRHCNFSHYTFSYWDYISSYHDCPKNITMFTTSSDSYSHHHYNQQTRFSHLRKPLLFHGHYTLSNPSRWPQN